MSAETPSSCSACGTPLPADGVCGECLHRDTALIDQGLTHPGAAGILDFPTQIGPFRIQRVLGEGGMGIVYLAEQAEPFRRHVALKVIKIGMNTREVVARFEGERQALALMSHSHIAQIFGAGATEDGRPYFVMEHVDGVPITDYCDRNELSTRERLELFVQVCSAVEHAHQKGIIHRDIKPQNILVTVQDGRPAPKVIDFGVAKATHQRLTEKTVFTHLGLIIGTPEYMSPEQAELGGVEITHATDIYSLGVVLYELLVSSLPFDPTALRRAGYAEIQRIIREEEPVPPSTRLTDLGEKAVDVAQHRRTDLSTLARQLKGDLDWIALKALEKEPARRYPSAAALAADVSRHLSSDRVLARPSSLRARVRRFSRRHPLRSRAIAAGAAIVLIMGAASAWTWVMSRGVPLTIAKPVGGTIIGGSLICGTRGAVCSTTRPAGETVEFFAVPDPDFEFGGFTGECAPTGRLLMSGPRACGATFRKAEPIGPQLTRLLAIDRPIGGTLVSASGILCGTLGSLCAANLPDGAPVALKAVPDTGYLFSQFTGACAGGGETTLTEDRTCGATFALAAGRSDRTQVVPQETTPRPTPSLSTLPESLSVSTQPEETERDRFDREKAARAQLDEGRKALAAKQFDPAIAALQAAMMTSANNDYGDTPGEAAALLNQARQGKSDIEADARRIEAAKSSQLAQQVQPVQSSGVNPAPPPAGAGRARGAPSVVPAPPPRPDSVRSSGTPGFTIDYPRKDWMIATSVGSSALTLFHRSREATVAVERMTMRVAIESHNLTDEIAKLEIDSWKLRRPNATQFSHQFVSAYKGPQSIIIDFKQPGAQGSEHVRLYVMFFGTDRYAVICTSTLQTFDKFKETFHRIALTLRPTP